MTEKWYNLYNLEPQFKNFLVAENFSSISLKNYLSDFRYFVGWLNKNIKYQIRQLADKIKNKDLEDLGNFLTLINSDFLNLYKKYLLENNIPLKTINRRLSTIRKFFSFCISQGWLKENPAKKISNIKNTYLNEISQENINLTNYRALESHNIISNIKPRPSRRAGSNIFSKFKNLFTQKSQQNNNTFFSIQYYIGLLIILIFVATLGAGIYNQFFNKSEKTFAYPLAPTTRAGRILSFQGRLTDTLGNPITTATNVTFKLYNISTGGTALYTAGSCSITPNQDGIFNVLIGGSGYTPNPPQEVCGTEIPASIFTENANIYMGITVASDAEMTPRQQIANVGYAINAETLQGLPPGTNTSTIPYINQDGNLLIAAATPGIRSTFASSDFTLSSAKATIIQSAGTGDIILQATESGTLKLRTGGNSDVYNRLVIDNNGLVGIGLTPSQKLEVSGNIYANSGQIRLGNFSSAPSAIGSGSIYYNSTNNKIYYYNGSAWTEVSAGSNSSWWTQSLGLLYPINSTLDLSIGGNASSSAKFSFTNINSGTPTFKMNQASAFDLADTTVNALNIDSGLMSFDTQNSRVGIGTTSPAAKLDVSGNIFASGKAKVDYITDYSNENYGLDPAGTTNFGGYSLKITSGALLALDSGNVGIGTTNPQTKLEVSGNIAMTFGNRHITVSQSQITNSNGGSLTISGGLSNNTGNGGPLYLKGGDSENSSLSGGNVYINGGDGSTKGNIIIANSTEKVGIGTNSPSSLLSIGSSSEFQVNSSGDIVKIKNLTYSWPSSHITDGFLKNDGSGNLSWSTKITASALKWNGLTDPGANLTLNHGTNTTTFNTSATTQTFFTINTNSLTSGKGLYLSSTSTGLTGNLAEFVLSGSNVGNTGNVVRIAQTGTSSAAVPLMVTNLGTGLSFRVNDRTGDDDTTPFVIDASGNVGVGITAPIQKLHTYTNGADNIILSDVPTGDTYDPLFTMRIQSEIVWNMGVDSSDTNKFKIASGSNWNNLPTGTKLTIDSSGNVGIGTTSPNYKLSVIDTPTYSTVNFTNAQTDDSSNYSSLSLRVGTATTGTATRFLKFIANTTGDTGGTGVGRIRLNNGNVAYETGGADFAEYFYTTENVEFGDIVAISPTDNNKVNRASRKSIPIGVASDKAAFIGNATTEDLQSNQTIVGLLGQIKTKVINLNGPIKVGDPITVSDITGVGMKAIKAGIILGRALEPYNNLDPNAVGKIMVLINVSWYDPDIYLTSSGDLNITQDQQGNYKVQRTDSSIIDRIATFAENIVGKIKAGLIEVENTIVNNTLIAKTIVAENINLTTENITIAGKKLSDYIDERINQILFSQKLFSSSEKIVSPIVETEEIKFKSQNSKVKTEMQNAKMEIVNFQDKPIAEFRTDEKETALFGTLEVNSNQEKGKLAQIILKNLEEKSTVVIDASGNASFSGQLVADSLEIKNTATISGSLIAKEASVEGKLVAKEIEAENIKALENNSNIIVNSFQDLQNKVNEIPNQVRDDINNKINDINDNINDIQKLLAEIKNQPLPDVSNQTNLSNTTDFNQFQPISTSFNDLTVTGNSNFYNVSISGSILAEQLFIENNSIISLGQELKLSALSKINLFDGAVIIAKDGTITTKGELIAEGGIKTNTIAPQSKDDLSVLGNLNILGNLSLPKATDSAIIAASENFVKNGIFAPAIETASTSAGIGILPKNSTEVIIYNDNVHNNSLIYLTPSTNTNSRLSVIEKKYCDSQIVENCKPYFKVVTSMPENQDVKFNWLIIN